MERVLHSFWETIFMNCPRAIICSTALQDYVGNPEHVALLKRDPVLLPPHVNTRKPMHISPVNQVPSPLGAPASKIQRMTPAVDHKLRI